MPDKFFIVQQDIISGYAPPRKEDHHYYAKANNVCLLVTDEHDPVFICELENGERFPVKKEMLAETTKTFKRKEI